MTDFGIVFVGGAPRSGTTLVQKMLNANSEVYGGPEFDRLGDIVHLRNLLQYTNRKGRSDAYFTSDVLDQKVAQFIVNLLKEPAIKNDARIICEKTPNNILHLNELLKIHQQAKGIVVIRDPRSIVASMKNVKRKALEANELVPGFTKTTNNSIALIEKYWNAGFEAVNNHFGRIKIVIYEELINDTETVLTKLCDFLEVSFQPLMLQPGLTDFDRGDKKDNIWYSGADHNRNIDTSSLEKWKSILTVAEKSTIEGKLMESYLHWKSLREGKDSTIKIEYSSKSGLREKIAMWLSQNARFRGILTRLVKDSYSNVVD